MAVRSSIVTVTEQPTLLSVGTDQDSNPGYRDVAIQNTGTTVIYLGGPDVTTDIGFPVQPGAGLFFTNVMPDSLVYALVNEGSNDVAVLQVGV